MRRSPVRAGGWAARGPGGPLPVSGRPPGSPSRPPPRGTPGPAPPGGGRRPRPPARPPPPLVLGLEQLLNRRPAIARETRRDVPDHVDQLTVEEEETVHRTGHLALDKEAPTEAARL